MRVPPHVAIKRSGLRRSSGSRVPSHPVWTLRHSNPLRMLRNMLRCEECWCVSDNARGWFAFVADLPDDDYPPEVATYCPPAPRSTSTRRHSSATTPECSTDRRRELRPRFPSGEQTRTVRGVYRCEPWLRGSAPSDRLLPSRAATEWGDAASKEISVALNHADVQRSANQPS